METGSEIKIQGFPVADTPAQQRCVGDPDNSGGVGKTPSAHVFEKSFQWFGSLLPVSCFS